MSADDERQRALVFTLVLASRLASEPLAIASRYAGDDTVIGIDLRNEPGSPPVDEQEWPRNGGAMWGEPDSPLNPRPRDWARAVENAASAVLACNPRLLVFVEGVRGDPAGPVFEGTVHLYWPGGNLIGVTRAGGRRPAPRPVTLSVPGRLVYSVHDYGPDMFAAMPWCQKGSTALTPARVPRGVGADVGRPGTECRCPWVRGRIRDSQRALAAGRLRPS